MRITALLAPPRFEDEEKTRQAFLLHVILWTLILVTILFFLYVLLSHPVMPSRPLVQVIFGLVVNTFLLILMRHGYVRGASIIQVAVFWLFFTATAWTGSGVNHQAFQIGYALVISIAGFLIGVRAALIVVGVSLLSGALMVTAGDTGWWSFKAPDKALTIWVVTAILFPILAVLQHLAGRLLRSSLAQSRLSQAQYRDLVEEAPIGILVLSEVHSILFANPAAAASLGKTPQALAGRTISSLIAAEEESQHVSFLVNIDRESSWSEAVLLHDDGRVVPVSIKGKRMPDGQLQVLFEDRTEQRRAEEVLRERQELINAIVETSQDWIWAVDSEGDHTYSNPAVEQILGYGPEEITGYRLDLLHEEDRSFMQSQWPEWKSAARGWTNLELRWRNKRGEYRLLESSAVPILGSKGEFQGFRGVDRDITERRRMEEALRESEEKYRLLVEGAGEGIVLTQEGKVRYLNPRAMEFIGYSNDEIMAQNMFHFVYPDDRESLAQLYLKKLAGEEVPVASSWRIIDKTGAVKWVQSRSTILTWGGKPSLLTFLVDITEQREAEEALRGSQQLFSTIFRANPAAVILSYFADGKCVDTNEAYARLTGYEREEIIGKTTVELNIWISAEERQRVVTELAEKGHMENVELTLRRKSGEMINTIAGGEVITLTGQRYILSFFVDITERRRMEAALRESEEKYRNILETIEEGYYEVDIGGNFIFFNDSVSELLGYSKEELIGMDNRQYTEPENARKLYMAFNEVYRTGKPIKGFDWEIIRKDGTKRFLEASVSLMKDIEGKPTGFRGIARDVTGRIQAEAERQRLEAQLQQAQKMEAIGTLAGGIAHDFNNLLMGIQGQASLMLADMDSSHPHFGNLSGIEEYVRSAADLTKQLLSFARGGKYEVKVTDLNILAERSAALFGRTKKEITIHRKFQPDLWTVEVDRRQMEQVLLNIFVNAWQAMPAGGDLYLQTENVVLEGVRIFWSNDQFWCSWGTGKGIAIIPLLLLRPMIGPIGFQIAARSE